MSRPTLKIAKEGFPFILPAAAMTAALIPFSGPAAMMAGILTFYFIYFFRDPERTAASDSAVIVAGADGILAGIKEVPESEITGLEEMRQIPGQERLFKAGAVRISIFLSLFDVHINRTPIAGKVVFLKYYPGKRFFTFTEKSSRYNQHNAILIQGRTSCLVHQIVGPVARRVVAWPQPGQEVAGGERIGLMKFGSRLDMYFSPPEINIQAKIGQRMRAGETIIAVLKKDRAF